MNNVLYISNIEVPYRNEFFNQLSEKVELTVLYERKKSSNRDEKWTNSVKPNYNIEYLKGIKIKNEFTFDLRILKYIFSKRFDNIIIGCYNSPSQMLAILIMKILKKDYILNLDGEYFLDGNTLKKKIKRFFLKGAKKYLIAGKKAAINLSKHVSQKKIYPYHFSSLTRKEIEEHSKDINQNFNNKVLVVGQYFEYKGLDVALECAKENQLIKYKFIGSGKRSEMLENKVKEMELTNVEVIPFLKKDELYKEYKECLCLLLPSKQECWGLVINEAASFGTPIVSTIGSGAAVEFIYDKYSIFLADAVNKESIMNNLNNLMKYKEIDRYKNYLINISSKYTIEENVETFLKCLYD